MRLSRRGLELSNREEAQARVDPTNRLITYFDLVGWILLGAQDEK